MTAFFLIPKPEPQHNLALGVDKITTRQYAETEIAATCRRLSVVTDELGYLIPRLGEPLRTLVEQLNQRITAAREDAVNMRMSLASGDYDGSLRMQQAAE